MSGRERRQQLVIDILQRQPIDSQDALRRTLNSRGIDVTQATLSRDLRELGAVKTPRGYQLPSAASASPQETAHAMAPLVRALAGYVTRIEPAATQIVLRTGPGHAQLVAVEIDRAGLPGVAGCLAGDDTIFVAVVSAHRAKELAREFLRLADLEPDNGA